METIGAGIEQKFSEKGIHAIGNILRGPDKEQLITSLNSPEVQQKLQASLDVDRIIKI